MRVQLEPAFVLRTAPYSDTSLLVEVFSREHGRVGLVARGARAPRSRTRALLQPFRPVLVSWIEKGDLGTLSGIEEAGPPLPLSGEDVFSGWYLNELLLKLVQRHDPHPDLFDDYADALAELPVATERALRLFEKRLLAGVGFALDFPDDLAPDSHYRFLPDSGAFVVDPGPDAAIQVTGRALNALRDDTLADPADLKSVKPVLREALRPLLAGREIVTARVLRELRRK
jgi:DNA repair protein RecO (recombination protein O)